MYRAVLTLLVGLMLLASGSAHAFSLNCERTTESHDAFSTQQAFESWFPRYIRPTAADQVPVDKKNQVRFQINGAIYDLTTSKWMLGKLPAKGNYKSVTGVRYKCNASSDEVKVAFRKNNESLGGSTQAATTNETLADNLNITSAKLSVFSDEDICALATNQGDWEIKKEHTHLVKEAKSRGLTCGIAEAVTEELTSDKTERGWLGVFVADVFPDIAANLGLSKNEGVFVFHVADNSPAQLAGLKSGDVILKLGFTPVGNYRQFESIASKFHAGRQIEIEFFRFGKMNSKSVFLASRSQVMAKTPKSGLINELKHLTVDRIKEDSPASSVGIQKGDRILGIADDERYYGAEEFAFNFSNILSKRPPKMTFFMLRAGKVQFISIRTKDGQSLLNSQIFAPIGIEVSSVNFNFDELIAASTFNNQSTTSPPAKPVASASETTNASTATATATENNDASPPTISILSDVIDGPQANIKGRVFDEAGIAEVIIDGSAVRIGGDGSFAVSFYVPRSGKTIEIVAFDSKGNKATKSLTLARGQVQQATGPTFASLNPSGKRVRPNEDALALIIGVADYERTPARAAYADKDAQTFYDYAMLKLGIHATNIKELINTDANEAEVRLAVKDWIGRSTKQGHSDVYVFFAGHGLANQSGDDMYLLPVDGEPRLLSDTAIARERLFADIAAAKPRSVTVFLDTCYSGTTRGTDMLIASRPIAIKALKQSVPEGFTVMTAAAGDQTAKPLEEAKHGMFSYFLMKGMEGDADANKDNQITAGELHAYVQQNVIQQSSGSQTPELQGDAERVLVRFQ